MCVVWPMREQLVWPSEEEVRVSNLGYASGGSIPGPAKNLYKTQANQFLVLPLLHRWQATRRCARNPVPLNRVVNNNSHGPRQTWNLSTGTRTST